MNLPDNLPPLPPVPSGYAVNAWEYRGTNWNPGEFRNYAYYKPGLSDGWVPSFGMKPIGSSGHYIEAVREPAEPSAQLFATLDPENGEDQPSRVERHLQWLESVRPGWAQEIRECMATGVEARVCGWRGIESAPRDGTEVWAYNREQVRMKWIEGDEYALWIYADELLTDADPTPEQPTHWQPLPQPPEGGQEKP